jgi:RNA polymerase sigma factor (TIGR02999 family)
MSRRAKNGRTLTHSAAGDHQAADALLTLVYDDLRALAARYMAGERSGHILQPTALVHEAYLRLVEHDRIDWRGKTHFFAMAAIQMRRILVEHAREAVAEKRGHRPARVSFADDQRITNQPSLEILAVHEALERLGQRHSRQSEVAELRLFAGLTVKETAHAIGVTEMTVSRDWRVARAWLARELSRSTRARG